MAASWRLISIGVSGGQQCIMAAWQLWRSWRFSSVAASSASAWRIFSGIVASTDAQQ